MRSLRDRDLGTRRQQHPDRNPQSPPGWIYDTDCPISSLRSAKDPQGNLFSARAFYIKSAKVGSAPYCALTTASGTCCIVSVLPRTIHGTPKGCLAPASPKLRPFRCKDMMKLTHKFAEMTPEKTTARPAYGRDWPSLRDVGSLR